ncbi:MAG: peptidase domain-containing ABC transporter [Muribaculaceae bacterium]
MRYPFVHQHDSMQCGAACLSMICKFYGKSYPLNWLDMNCFPSRDGVSMLAMKKAAEAIGFEVECNRIKFCHLCEIQFPSIIHWNNNHFVVLYGCSKGKYILGDPARGIVRYSESEMISHLPTSSDDAGDCNCIVMTLNPTHTFYDNVEEVQADDISTLKFIRHYIFKYRRYFFHIMLCLGIGNLLQLIMPFLTQSIVDYGIRYRDIALIWLILIGEMVVVVGRTMSEYIRRWWLLEISMRVNISLLSDFFIKLLRLPMSYFDIKQLGDMVQRLSDYSRVQSFLSSDTLNVLFAVVSFVVYGVVLFMYSSKIFIVFVLGSLLQVLWVSAFLQKRRMIDYEKFELMKNNQNQTYQFLTYMQEIKLQRCGERKRMLWEDLQADIFSKEIKLMKLIQLQDSGRLLLDEIKNIFVTVLAATAVIDSSMTLGGMMAVQYIVGQFGGTVSQLLYFVNRVQDVKISLERISEVHLQEDELMQSPNLSLPRSGDIRYDDVIFSYDKYAEMPTLNNINIVIPEGNVTAIVGHSGCGKSTLMKLLLAYNRPLSGKISIGGADLCDIDVDKWREACGVVMQDGAIFSESIAQNIAVGDGPIDMNRVMEAARIACIDEFIDDLPLKYDTIIGDMGVKLSQGQRQRILIARAVYKEPRYLLFDEATNSLDTITEQTIVSNLNKFFVGRTAIVIAHRLSTVKHADQIIVLNKGRVVECGNHQSLLDRKGEYYQLVKNQLELQ